MRGGSPYPRADLYLAIAAAVTVNVGAPVWMRALAALPLVLYLPGSTLIAAAFPDTSRTLELRVLAVAMSLASTILLGVVLGMLGRLDAHAWATGLCAITICGSIASLRKEHPSCGLSTSRDVSGRGRLVVRPQWAPALLRGTLSSGDLCLVALSGCIGVGAFTLARHGAVAQTSASYTDFWMVPEDADRPALATIGIRNQEGRSTIYHVDVLQRGRLVDEWPAIALKPGATFTSKIAFDPLPPGASTVMQDVLDRDSSRVEARLYKDGAFGIVYRKAWVALPTLPHGLKPIGTDR